MEHAKELGVKGVYPVMSLPYHNRVKSAFIDGMHTIKDVVCNIMDVVLGKKEVSVRSLELTSAALAIADGRYAQIRIPCWIDLPKQTKMISNPKSLKTHDWKQASITSICLIYKPVGFLSF